MPQAAAFLERLLNPGVGVEDTLPAEQLDGVEEVAARSNRRVDVEAVFDSGIEVVTAMTGRCVHRARAGLECDVVAEHTHRRAGIEWMLKADVLE